MHTKALETPYSRTTDFSSTKIHENLATKKIAVTFNLHCETESPEKL